MLYLYELLFINSSCLFEYTENNKKRKSITSVIRCFVSYFGMNVVIFHVNISYYIHACVKLYALNMCVMF